MTRSWRVVFAVAFFLFASKASGCNFDTGMCGWTNVKGNDIQWQRHQGATSSSNTGPSYDHTNGTAYGYYVYVETSGARSNAVATLASPGMNATMAGSSCMLSMAYHMYGSNIGTLEVLVHALYSERLQWSRQGDQGNQWLVADISLGAITEPFQVYVRTTHSTCTGSCYMGDIAVDDLRLIGCPAGGAALPPPTIPPPQPFPNHNCTFENGMCFWSNSITNPVDWVQRRGRTPSYGTGPSDDHTLRNGNGSYIFIETSSLPVNSNIILQSPLFSSSGSACELTFAYHFYGNDIGNLDVYLEMKTGGEKLMWNKNGNQGNVWHVAKVFIGTQSNPFQVVFNATHFGGIRGDMALDDLYFINCDPAFKLKPCSPKQFQCATSKLCVDLDRQCDMSMDCYDGSDEAKCNFPFSCDFQTSMCGFTNDETGDDFDWISARGKMVSYSTGPTADHTTGNATGRYVYIESSSPRQPGDKANLLSPIFSPTSSSASCSMRFYAYMYGMHIGNLEVYLVTSNGQPQSVLRLNLTGDQGQEWQRVSLKISSPNSNFRLEIVGVRGNGYAGDIAIDDFSSSLGCPGLVTQPTPKPLATADCDFEQGLCAWQNEYVNDLNWIRYQGQGFASIFSSSISDHTIGNASGHYITIDSAYSASEYGTTSKIYSPMMKMDPSNCRMVFFYFIHGYYSGNLTLYQTTDKGKTLTSLWSANGDQGSQWHRANVTIARLSTNFQLVFEASQRNPYIFWRSSDIAVDDISFEGCSPPATCPAGKAKCASGFCYRNNWECNGVDDCDDASDEIGCANSCDFEQGLCGWKNVQADSTDWTRSSGTTLTDLTGPSYDHTTYSSSGFYVYLETSGLKAGSTAILQSKNYNHFGHTCSFSFAYIMNGQDVGIIAVDILTNSGTRMNLWSRSGNLGTRWFTTTLHLGVADSGFVIQIIATHGGGSLGDIAIDDLELIDCHQTPTVAPPTPPSPQDFPHDSNCDFEQSLCDWINAPDDEVDWVPHSGSTSSYGTGPSTDHTSGAVSGHYIYVESSGLSRGAWAVLQSRTFKKSGQMCQLQFAYNMNGYSIGSLSVLLMYQNGQNKTVWSQSGDHGDNWLIGTVRLGQVTASFQIQFRMSHGSGYGGDIALDDISFSGCDPSKKPPKCSQFQCKNHWCEPTARVCDFTDDCGDQSDEVLCIDPKKTSLYCDFEKMSMCGFLNAVDDDYEWLASRGSSYYYSRGPNTDHTTGTNQGYYIYTEADYTNKIGDKARFVSSTYSKPAANCQLTFYYHLGRYGSETLNVWIQPKTGSPTLAFSVNGSSGSTKQLWQRVAYNITATSQYQVVFEAVHGSFYYYSAAIAVDDIALSASCGTSLPVAVTPVSTPPDCDFESQGFCLWKNGFFNDLDWNIEQGSTNYYSYLPSKDHTLTGNSSGHYAFVRSSYRFFFTYGKQSAELTGPVMQNADWNCRVIFYYVLSGSPGNLTLYQHPVDKQGTVQSGKGTSIYSITGSNGNSWQRAVAKLSIMSSNFVLTFHADSSSYYGSALAIDDIKFESCTPPASCQSDEFQCTSSGSCIPSSWKCNEVDDCGQSEDEVGCANECDFEQDFCSWQNDYSDDANWRRYSGPTPSTQTGPSVDHSFGTTAGYYIYLEASYVQNGAEAYLDSPYYNLSQYCYVKFAYSMYGGGVNEMGTLEVQMITSSGYRVLWSKSGDQGAQWHDATVGIVTRGSYKLRFAATKGTGYHSDIALDDVDLIPCTGTVPTLPPTTPPPPQPYPSGTCDFESKTMCFWRNPLYDDIDWQLRAGRTPSFNTGPSSDHTLGTSQGHYIYIETSGVSAGSYAALESPVFQKSGFDCELSFAYSMFGAGIGSLQLYVVQGGSQREVWFRSGDQGSSWHIGKVYLGTMASFNVVFNATHGTGFTGDVALDDIAFVRCDPAIVPKPCNASEFQCTNKRCIPKEYQCDLSNHCGNSSDEHQPACRGYQTCNFEVDNCGYVNEQVSDAFDWSPGKGETQSIGTGPPSDHTYGTPNGHYMYIETSYPRVYGDKAILLSPEFLPALQSKHCRLRFYSSMNGASVGSLAVVVRYTKGNFQSVLMNMTGDQGTGWLRMSLSIATSQNFRVEFVATRGTSYASDIAIDDISWTPGCPKSVPVKTQVVDEASCNFESGNFCSWKNDFFNDVAWLVQQGSTSSYTTGPSGDHTTRNATGQYAYVEASYSQQGESARLASPLLMPAKSNKYCYMVFYYHMYGADIGTLNVYSRPKEGSVNINQIFSRSGDQGDSWQKAQIDLPTTTSPYQIVFDVVQGSGYRGDIAIDDIRFLLCIPPSQCSSTEFQCSNGYCIPSPWQCDEMRDCQYGSDETNCSKLCTFERSATCNVWNSSSEGDLLWQRQSRSSSPFTTGPTSDHTLNSDHGHFLISVVSSSSAGQKAILTSTSKPEYTWCQVRFAYYMDGADVGTLEVMIKTDGGTEIQLWSRTGSQGSAWNDDVVTLEQTHGSYAVRFVFTSKGGYRGYVALDDVALNECGSVKPTILPSTAAIHYPFPSGSCGFESDLCHYYNLKSNGVDWVRRAGATPSFGTGPIVDHTLGTSAGYYVYIESSGLASNSTAVLESPVYKATNAMCGLRFAYHLYGANIGKLELFLQDFSGHGPGKSLWKKQGNQGNGWHHGLAFVGAFTSLHQFAFRATHSSGFQGDIAIDDVGFSLCDPGYVAPACVSNEFKCTSGQCVSNDVVCDNEADCNDNSDESSSVCKKYKAAYLCDFSSSMCDFANDDADDFDWISGDGDTVSYGTGPGFDHTTDSENGRYLYIEASYPRIQGEEALVTSPVFHPAAANSKCTIRMFYHMHGQHIGSLAVLMRTADAAYSKFGAWKQMWSMSGTQGNKWLRLELQPISGMYQVGIRGTIGNGFAGDIAVDDFSLTKDCGDVVHRPTQAAQKPSSCNFEQDFCGYKNAFLNDIDWASHAGFTASSGTGPNYDHTFQNSSGHYIYMETSTGELGYNATLVSPLYSVDSSQCMFFYYNMYGSDVGNLTVFILSASGKKSVVLSVVGNQGSFWQQGKVKLQTGSNYRIVFEGMRGNGFHGDIAIDDISFGSCSGTSAPPTVSLCLIDQFACHDRSGCVPLASKCDFVATCPDGSDEASCTLTNCDFEKNFCNWNIIDGAFAWARHQGQSQQTNGPSGGHNAAPGSGHYLMAVEGSPSSNDVATLKSAQFAQSGTNCRLSFWYYMSGSNVGSLTVKIQSKTGVANVWQQTGSQTNQWKSAYAIIGSKINFYILISVTKLPGSSGTISVDDLQLTNCGSGASYACTNEEFTCTSNGACIEKTKVCDFRNDCPSGSDEDRCGSYAANCNFEPSCKSWNSTVLASSNFAWKVGSGEFSGNGKGPSTDRNDQTNGHFMYVSDSDATQTGEKVQFMSPLMPTVTKPGCSFRFSYYIIGDQAGSLTVYAQIGTKKTTLFKDSHATSQWIEKALPLHTVSNYHIVFEAVSGLDRQTASISIDNLAFSLECPHTTAVTNPPPTNSQISPNHCGNNRMACISSGKCIAVSSKCDGFPDCPDKSDEHDCNVSPMNCNFDDAASPFCNWTAVSVTSSWMRLTGSAPGDGPAADHTGAGGYYLVNYGPDFVKTPGQTAAIYSARLLSRKFDRTDEGCTLSFYYFIHSPNAKLTVSMTYTAGGSPHYAKTLGMNKAGKWTQGVVELSSASPFTVAIESNITAKGADVAIDDISFRNCPVLNKSPATGGGGKSNVVWIVVGVISGLLIICGTIIFLYFASRRARMRRGKFEVEYHRHDDDDEDGDMRDDGVGVQGVSISGVDASKGGSLQFSNNDDDGGDSDEELLS
eukprot:m.13253 g.13253  ORF g.13253 m.13253 type:complete len:3799 (+) comp24600_c0_seq1:127-11523(+)